MFIEIDDDNVLWSCVTEREEKTIYIPDGVVVIDANVFDGNENIECVYVPSSVKTIGYSAFARCNNLKKVVLSEGLTLIRTSAFDSCVSLDSIEIPSTVTTIGDNAFTYCVNLKKVVLPTTIQRIGSRAFKGCLNLEDINISPDIESLGYEVFVHCEKLFKDGFFIVDNTLMDVEFAMKEVIIPDNVTAINGSVFGASGSDFQGNGFVETVFMNNVESIPDSLFASCRALKNVVITDATKKFGKQVFKFTDNLKVLVVPDGGKYYENDNDKNDGNGFFYDVNSPATFFIKDENALSDVHRFLCYKDYKYEPVSRQKFLSNIWNNTKVLVYLIEHHFLDDYEIQNMIIDTIDECKNAEAIAIFLDYINSPEMQVMRKNGDEQKRSTALNKLDMMMQVSTPNKISGKAFFLHTELKSFDSYEDWVDLIEGCKATVCSKSLFYYLHLYRNRSELKDYIYVIVDEEDDLQGNSSFDDNKCICITEKKFNEMIGRKVED